MLIYLQDNSGPIYLAVIHSLKIVCRILSLLRHPVCATVLTVRLDLPVMTDLFRVYEIDIICLWTWHHLLVNSCEATQAFGREALRAFPPPLFALIPAFRNSIDRRKENSLQLLSTSSIPALFRFLSHSPSVSIVSVLCALSFCPICLSCIFFHGGQGMVLIAPICLAYFRILWLPSITPLASMKRHETSHPILHPC